MEQQTLERPGERISEQEYREIVREVAPAHIYLQPIASPWSLGMMGFAAATFVVGANLAGWYGVPGSQVLIFPFILVLGGLAQLVAASWGFRARDLLATTFFGTWGSFWLGYGLQLWLFATGVLPTPIGVGQSTSYAFLLFALAAITLSCAAAALAENVGVLVTMLIMTAGAIVVGIGSVTGGLMTLGAGGLIFAAAALVGWYTATALMVESAFNRAILPIGEFRPTRDTDVLDEGIGEPGVVRYHKVGTYRGEHPHTPVPQT